MVHPRTLSQYSETNYCSCEGEAKWNHQRWTRRETTDIGNDAQFMGFVRYRATEDYVEQVLFCCPLAKHTAKKEMFKKVDSFTKEHQLSRTNCVSACADGASGMIRIKKFFLIYEKGKQKYLGNYYCCLRREKNRQPRNLRRSDSF